MRQCSEEPLFGGKGVSLWWEKEPLFGGKGVSLWWQKEPSIAVSTEQRDAD